MIHIHDLHGCAPAPLAHYLKALGILSLLSGQADASVRGWWEGDRFRLATHLDREDLVRFLRDEYSPTPIFNPWGGRSGFYPGSSESSARKVLLEVERSDNPRFDDFRSAIQVVRTVIGSFGGAKPEDEKRAHLIESIRREVRGRSSAWMATVVAVIGHGENSRLEYPAIFGTGGNEGSKGYASAYMAAIQECLLMHRWDHSLHTALFAQTPASASHWSESFGQFIPEGAASPWDLLFAFEGACTVRSSISSRCAADSSRWMSSPFFVAPAAYGFASAARLDEFMLRNGKESSGRGEQWFPLWTAPMLQAEVAKLFNEGRAATRSGPARSGWSMARAATSLGVRAGIREFVRYGYLQRDNLATHFAVPLGRMPVADQTPPNGECLDDLDAGRSWLAAIHKEARSKEAPTSLRLAQRRLQDALFSVVSYPGDPTRWQAVLLGLGDVEAVQGKGSAIRVEPVPPLGPQWVAAADDGSPEFRLALAAALQFGPGHGWERGAELKRDSVRRHWLPLDRKRPTQFATVGTGGQMRLHQDPAVVMRGRNGVDDAIALVERRLVEAAASGVRRLPLFAGPSAFAWPTDLASWLSGAVDTDRTVALCRALMALEPQRWAQQPVRLRGPAPGAQVPDAWIAIRLALLPWPLPDGSDPGADPAIFRRLASGDTVTAFELARRRLRAKGIATVVRATAVPPEVARRWAAAIAFPITPKTAAVFARRIASTTVQESQQ